jgi:hypothetical protein
MKQIILGAALLMFLTTGCMGIPLPFTDARFAMIEVNISSKSTNSTCTDLVTLAEVANELEVRHLRYLRSMNDAEAIGSEFFLHSLGEECKSRISRLDTKQIKNELFGDINIIPEPEKLRELGGYSFTYEKTNTRGGVEFTLHLNKASKGPERRMVAIYRLVDGKVIHFNYSGTDNVDTKSRSWPLDQFFGVAIGAAGKVVIP